MSHLHVMRVPAHPMSEEERSLRSEMAALHREYLEKMEPLSSALADIEARKEYRIYVLPVAPLLSQT